MSQDELSRREEEEFNTGPLSVLTQSVKNNTQVSFNPVFSINYKGVITFT